MQHAKDTLSGAVITKYAHIAKHAVADVGFCKGGCISAKDMKLQNQTPLQIPTPATVNAVLPCSVLSLLLRPQNVVWVVTIQ